MLAGLDEATSEAEIRPPLPDGKVFELTDEMALPDTPQSSFHKIEPEDDLEFAETAAARATHRQPAFEPPPVDSSRAAPPPQQILSRSTVSAVESAFNTLAHTVLSNNARTLEDLVKEMLRPMLKSWLDDNLPGMVERPKLNGFRADDSVPVRWRVIRKSRYPSPHSAITSGFILLSTDPSC